MNLQSVINNGGVPFCYGKTWHRLRQISSLGWSNCPIRGCQRMFKSKAIKEQILKELNGFIFLCTLNIWFNLTYLNASFLYQVIILKLTEEYSMFLLNFVGLHRRDLLDFRYVIYSVFLIKYLILQRWKINSNLTMGNETIQPK